MQHHLSVATNTASCPSSHPLPHNPRTNQKVLPEHTLIWNRLQARSSLGHSTSPRHEYRRAVGNVSQLRPCRCNQNRISSASRERPTGRATGQGRVGEQVGNQQVRQKHWPIPWVGTPAIPHRYGVRYEGGGTGGPAPISSGEPGLVEYATRRSPGLKGQQTQVTLSPQGTSTCRSMWR
jgi:hypothetical protein